MAQVWIDQLDELLLPFGDENALKTLLLGGVPLLAVWLYVKFIRVPPAERAVKFNWAVPPEAKLDWTPKMTLKQPTILAHLSQPSLIPLDAPNSTTSFITCYAPATGAHLATIPSASSDDISAKIANATAAQTAWAQTSWAQRRKVIYSLLSWLLRDVEEITRVACRDTGKTMVDAAFGEVLTTAEKLRWVIAQGESHLVPESRPTNLVLAHKVSHVHYEPLGVVAAIVSWNYPFHNILGPIIAALFAGNAIVVKPSENVAWSSHHYVRAVRDCLSACGHSPELVQIVTCLPDSVEALTGDERIKHITFIGSEQVGKKVAIKGAEVGTPVLLELGGKDACVILDSADVNYFSDTWMRAAFQAAGQNCIGVERFVVHDSLYDKFVETMRPRVQDLQVGDVLAPTAKGEKPKRIDVGAMVTDRLFDELESLIAAAVKDGARLLVGGKRVAHPQHPNGHYFQPTLLVDVTPTMAIAQQEVFAPVMTVMRVSSREEAVAVANGTRYGLGASVFGRNKADCDWVASRLKTGMVCTNDFGVFYLNQSLPFGGVASSGYGRFAGKEGLRGLTNPKAVTVDRFHGWVQTGIPPLLAYPIRSGEAAWQFVGGLVGLMYGEGVRGKASGLWRLVTAKE